ncbi:MAG TPA: hypothetical protein VML96_12965 [Egibacteraceae bacterium]|nr:hypothetical protein [Egibacteraceae bacterium]
MKIALPGAEDLSEESGDPAAGDRGRSRGSERGEERDMDFIDGPPWGSSSITVSHTFDVDAAVTFLRSQAAALCRALRDADDFHGVAEVLRDHDASHEKWLELAAGVDRTLGHGASDQFATLYALHGRVAGSLEQGLKNLLSPEVAEQVHGDLAERLSEQTEETARRLRGVSTSRSAASI